MTGSKITAEMMSVRGYSWLSDDRPLVFRTPSRTLCGAWQGDMAVLARYRCRNRRREYFVELRIAGIRRMIRCYSADDARGLANRLMRAMHPEERMQRPSLAEAISTIRCNMETSMREAGYRCPARA